MINCKTILIPCFKTNIFTYLSNSKKYKQENDIPYNNENHDSVDDENYDDYVPDKTKNIFLEHEVDDTNKVFVEHVENKVSVDDEDCDHFVHAKHNNYVDDKNETNMSLDDEDKIKNEICDVHAENNVKHEDVVIGKNEEYNIKNDQIEYMFIYDPDIDQDYEIIT